MNQESRQALKSKVIDWLSEEGYPLEFAVARLFAKHEFSAQQGKFVLDPKTGAVSEIDVVADRSAYVDDWLVRISNVVECKWSKDKPWVVFTSPDNTIAESACIAQTIGNRTGDAILWAIAGNTDLWAADLFSAPARAGFGGRQAFSKNDYFYDAIQSVVRKSILLATRYDARFATAEQNLELTSIALPVVVVDGELFEAYLNGDNELVVEEVTHLKLHWRGSPDWPFHATVNVVRKEYLEKFVERRSADVEAVLDHITRSLEQLRTCLKRRNLDALDIKLAGRGLIGLPPLLRELSAGWRSNKKKQHKRPKAPRKVR